MKHLPQDYSKTVTVAFGIVWQAIRNFGCHVAQGPCHLSEFVSIVVIPQRIAKFLGQSKVEYFYVVTL